MQHPRDLLGSHACGTGGIPWRPKVTFLSSACSDPAAAGCCCIMRRWHGQVALAREARAGSLSGGPRVARVQRAAPMPVPPRAARRHMAFSCMEGGCCGGAAVRGTRAGVRFPRRGVKNPRNLRRWMAELGHRALSAPTSFSGRDRRLLSRSANAGAPQKHDDNNALAGS